MPSQHTAPRLGIFPSTAESTPSTPNGSTLGQTPSKQEELTQRAVRRRFLPEYGDSLGLGHKKIDFSTLTQPCSPALDFTLVRSARVARTIEHALIHDSWPAIVHSLAQGFGCRRIAILERFDVPNPNGTYGHLMLRLDSNDSLADILQSQPDICLCAQGLAWKTTSPWLPSKLRHGLRLHFDAIVDVTWMCVFAHFGLASRLMLSLGNSERHGAIPR